MAEQRPEPEQPEEPDDRTRWRGRHHDGISSIFGGLIIILLGVLLFMQNQGLVRADKWWQYFLVGLGAIFLVDAAVRYHGGAHPGAVRGRIIAGVIVGGVGVAFLIGWSTWWPLILILAGVAIMVGGLRQH